MAAYQYYVFASAFVLFLCVQSGYGLSCYQCNSHNDSRCALKELPEDLRKPCPSKSDVLNREGDVKDLILCRKIKQIIEFEVNGQPPDTRIIRYCGWDQSNYENRCYQRSGFGGRQEVCACDTDNCNGSSTAYASVVLLAGVLALLKVAL